MCKKLGWSIRHFLIFFARIGQNHQKQKRCARDKLVGVEEEKIEKSYTFKVWCRIQIQNFSTHKVGRQMSNLGLKNVGPLLFVYKGS